MNSGNNSGDELRRASFPIFMPFLPLPCCTSQDFSTLFNRNEKSEQPRLVPDLKNICFFTIKYDVNCTFFGDVFY